MDMKLAHTNIFINPYTMDIDVQANVVWPGFAQLHLLTTLVLPSLLVHISNAYNFYNLFTSLYLVKNSAIYLYVFTYEGIGKIL